VVCGYEFERGDGSVLGCGSFGAGYESFGVGETDYWGLEICFVMRMGYLYGNIGSGTLYDMIISTWELNCEDSLHGETIII
jgi:hypothetical protein